MIDRKIFLTLDQTRENLDSISPTYCGAKWTQVLFQFHLGRLHNCCLTPSQPIDKSALFESDQLIREREEFLKGNKIKECTTCWNAEDKGFVSDRLSKSSDPSVIPLYHSESRFSSKGIIPTYIELSLSNRCQFKCAYCSPENSSSLYNEVKEFGPYRTTDDYGHGDYLYRGDNFFLETDDNPYVDAFINWFPEISSKIKVLRFTGGEPLLSHRLLELLDLLVQYPAPDLELIFNSNLGIQPKILDQFLTHLKNLPKGSFGKISFVTSIDGWGEGAKIARWGLSLDLFEENYLKVREELPDAEIRFTCTVNILALPDLKNLLVKILEWKKTQKYSDQILMTAYPLIYPAFLSVGWCKSRFHTEIMDVLDFIYLHFVGDGEGIGFKTVEKDMLEKALGVDNENTKQKQLVDFTLFMLQHQERKKWTPEVLPLKVRDLLDEGIVNLKARLEENNLDAMTSLKAMLWGSGPVDKVRELLSHDLKAGLLSPWKVLDVQNSQTEKLSDDWFFWWIDEGHPEVADKMVSLFSASRLEAFFGYFLKKLLISDESFWFKASHCPVTLTLIPEKGLIRLAAFSPNPMPPGQQKFWYAIDVCRPDFRK